MEDKLKMLYLENLRSRSVESILNNYDVINKSDVFIKSVGSKQNKMDLLIVNCSISEHDSNDLHSGYIRYVFAYMSGICLYKVRA